MKTNPNEPIRTENGYWSDEKCHTQGGNGLSKREYFAALAMQGISSKVADYEYGWDAKQVAKDAVNQADALIAELNKEPK